MSGAIATPQRSATEAGLAALDRGGNAIDAALTACAALAVVYPHNCSVGGDLFALLHRPDGSVAAVNGSGAAPAALDAAAIGAGATRMPPDGPHTVTVPGAVAGWETLRGLGATSTLAEILAPAAELARAGCPVAPGLARAVTEDRDRLARDPGAADVFLAHGAPLEAGATLRQPALAATLELIGEEGPGALYGGEVGERLAAGLRRLGSRMTLEDLAAHRSELGDPLGRRYRDVEVLTHPPNSQGFVLLRILLALEELDVPLDALGPQAGLLARLFALASRHRDRVLADPAAMRLSMDELLDRDSIRALARRAREGEPQGRAQAPAGGDTVAVVAADEDGWAVSVIQSIWESFGSGILEPATGILLHNRGALFSLDPASPNVLEGGKRPAHTLMPVMVREGGALRVVGGTMGGLSQPQIHAQVLGRVLAGEGPTDAVAAPRWVVGADEAILAEPGARERCGDSLRATGMPVVELGELDEEVGHAQYLARAEGAWTAGIDPRSDGLP